MMVGSLISMVLDFQFQLLLHGYVCICLDVNKLIIILSAQFFLSFCFVYVGSVYIIF